MNKGASTGKVCEANPNLLLRDTQTSLLGHICILPLGLLAFICGRKLIGPEQVFPVSSHPLKAWWILSILMLQCNFEYFIPSPTTSTPVFYLFICFNVSHQPLASLNFLYLYWSVSLTGLNRTSLNNAVSIQAIMRYNSCVKQAWTSIMPSPSFCSQIETRKLEGRNGDQVETLKTDKHPSMLWVFSE